MPAEQGQRGLGVVQLDCDGFNSHDLVAVVLLSATCDRRLFEQVQRLTLTEIEAEQIAVGIATKKRRHRPAGLVAQPLQYLIRTHLQLGQAGSDRRLNGRF